MSLCSRPARLMHNRNDNFYFYGYSCCIEFVSTDVYFQSHIVDAMLQIANFTHVIPDAIYLSSSSI